MKKVRFGVVGVGNRGRDVMGEVIGKRGFELCALCDVNEENLKAAASFFEKKGVKQLSLYTDYEKMLKDENVDAVFVSTGADNHVPLVIMALEAGKHCLSEIPAISSIDEARALKKAVSEHPGLKYMIAENCVYWGFIRAWREFALQERFGDVVYAESEYLHAKDFRSFTVGDNKKDDWRKDFSPIKYLTHNLGPLLYVLDDECISVSAMAPDAIYNPNIKNPRNAVALFKTKKGAVIRILIVFGAYVGLDHNFRIIGTRGTIETDNIKNISESHSFARFSDINESRDKKLDIPITVSSYGENGLHGGADKKMVLDFIDIVLNDKKVELGVDFAIKISLPGIVADESARQGGVLLEIPGI